MKQKEITLMYIKILMFHNLEDTLSMIRSAGFEIIQISEESSLSKADWKQFYEDYKENPGFNNLVAFSYSSPIVACILEKENAVADFCSLIHSPYGNIIPDTMINPYGNWDLLTKDSNFYSIHGSMNSQRVKKEIELLFPGFNIDEEVDIQQFETASLI